MRMEQYRIDIGRDWRCASNDVGMTYTYPVPENAKGFYPYGFVRRNDSASDVMDWYGLCLDVKAQADATVFEAEVEAVLGHGRTAAVKVCVPVKDGCAHAEISFKDLTRMQVQRSQWQFLSGVTLRFDTAAFAVQRLAACRERVVCLDVPVRGLHADADENVVYQGHVCNCSDEPAAVSLLQQLEGWESLQAEIAIEGCEGAEVLLPPGGCVPFTVTLKVHGDMVPGGHEETVIKATGRTASCTGESAVSLKTLRTLPHPYIYHNRDGWKAVREKIDTYPCYQPAFRKYLASADGWVVEPPMEGLQRC